MRSTTRGASSIEYALLASLIAAVVAVTVGLLGIDVAALWNQVDF